jgi:AraC-like DNA-binding protein
LKLLQQHKINVGHYYSNLEHKTFSWLKAIVYIHLSFYLLWIIEDIVQINTAISENYFAEISTVLTLVMVYWIGYNGFNQHETFKQKLFNYNTTEDFIIEQNNNDNTKDSKVFQEIRKQIVNEKLFTNSKLNLRTLAKMLFLNEKELSRLINQHSNSNFHQFINQLRVEEFKLLMNSPKAQQFSVIGLAKESGFNSKSTFYNAFKTIEGMSPKEYENRL